MPTNLNPKPVPPSLPSLLSSAFARIAHGLRIARAYFGIGGSNNSGRGKLDSPDALRIFIHRNASHVAQSALYGYMKTRAGTRFPELFQTPELLASINLAKWQIYLACLSDLTLYSGLLLRAHIGSNASAQQIRPILRWMVTQTLSEVGTPQEAGEKFQANAARVLKRIASADLTPKQTQDPDTIFTASPQALVEWAPVADHLKELDTEIIRNSVRFRWHEVRRRLQKQLCAQEISISNGQWSEPICSPK